MSEFWQSTCGGGGIGLGLIFITSVCYVSGVHVHRYRCVLLVVDATCIGSIVHILNVI